MHKLILISFLVVVNFANATDGGLTCESPSLTESVADISDLLSEMTTDACNEVSNDVDLVNLMKCIPNTIDTYEKNGTIDKTCEGVSNPYIASTFLSQLVGPKYPGTRSNNNDQSSIVDFMHMDGKAANSSKEKIIAELQRNVLQFAHKTSCKPHRIVISRKFDSSLVVDSVRMGDNKAGSNSKVRTETDLRNELKISLATDEFKEKHIKLQQNYKRKYGQMIWAEKITQANCSTKVQEQDPRYYTWAPLPSPTCSKRVEINFENDSDKITSKNMGLLVGSENYVWLKGCIEKHKMNNLKVKNIRIDGSANRFTGKNRPGEMSEAVAYNKDLALRRAKSTEDNVLENLIGSDLYSEYKDSGKKTSITAKGEHGDGTSGPCPYTTKIDSNGRYSLKPEFKDKDSLRKYRYANIVVTFEDLKAAPQTAAQKAKKVRESHAVVGCKSYTISCKK